MRDTPAAAVDLYWIPLGAGGHSVRFNGRVFEAIEAARQRRPRCDLYHSALVVATDGDRYAIEIAPSPDADEAGRGVVATGAVGSRHLGLLRLFRYEVRCWRGGVIPDLAAAVGGPHRLTNDPLIARRVLALLGSVPAPVWGRDELGAGEMWNSNSMIAWLIASAGLPTASIGPPARGPAPGWRAGREVARRGARTALRKTTDGHCGGRPMYTGAIASYPAGMPTETETTTVHVFPHPRGRWFVRVGDDPATMTEHPTVNLAERQARRRAVALGLDVVLVHDRYQRVHESACR